MQDWYLPQWLTGLLLALPYSSLTEYWGHRAMHSWLMRKKHAEHHRDNDNQGWFGEFWDYFSGGLPLLLLGFLWSIEAGVGFVAGGALYACWAAYNHQIQHENPEVVFWLREPIHHLHHRDKMWKHNFGISTGIWDRLFGTYKAVEWKPAKRPRDYPWRSMFQIRWL